MNDKSNKTIAGLKDELSKLEKNKLINSVIIGVLIGIIIYAAAAGGGFFSVLLPIVILLIFSGQVNKANKKLNEVKDRIERMEQIS